MTKREIGSGPVASRLAEAVARLGGAHFVLVDPDRTTPPRAAALARECENAGVDAILFGSSTPLESDPDPIVRAIRDGFTGPLILFPGSAAQVRLDVDAILFLSLLSGRDPRFLITEQVAAAPRVLAAGTETIATGYVLAGRATGGSVARVTGTEPIPFEETAAIVAHAQAAACLGFALVYLEAGSGAEAPLPASLVRAVAQAAPLPLVVGGGIRTPDIAASLAAAGARFIVTGTAHEDGHAVRPFTDAIHVPAAVLS